MSGGGAGDRRGVASCAAGDRPVRAARAVLIGLDGMRVAIASLVTDDRTPPVVMFEGEPFLFDSGLSFLSAPMLTYVQARAYRADAMVEDLRA